MMTPRLVTRGGICEAPKNSTVPNLKDKKKKHPKGCFLHQTTQNTDTEEKQKSQWNQKTALTDVISTDYTVISTDYTG